MGTDQCMVVSGIPNGKGCRISRQSAGFEKPVTVFFSLVLRWHISALAQMVAVGVKQPRTNLWPVSAMQIFTVVVIYHWSLCNRVGLAYVSEVSWQVEFPRTTYCCLFSLYWDSREIWKCSHNFHSGSITREMSSLEASPGRARHASPCWPASVSLLVMWLMTQYLSPPKQSRGRAKHGQHLLVEETQTTLWRLHEMLVLL